MRDLDTDENTRKCNRLIPAKVAENSSSQFPVAEYCHQWHCLGRHKADSLVSGNLVLGDLVIFFVFQMTPLLRSHFNIP